jgi:hypothetical protein
MNLVQSPDSVGTNGRPELVLSGEADFVVALKANSGMF